MQYKRAGDHDGLCGTCRFRRYRLTAEITLLAVALLLLGGLPIAWTALQAQGRFTLDATWALMYAGIAAFTGAAFGFRVAFPGQPAPPPELNSDEHDEPGS